MTNIDSDKQAWGVFLSQEFAKVLLKRADKENRDSRDLLVYLAQLGAECERLHKNK